MLIAGLKYLHVRNFAIIEDLELDFEPGLTVFTGETGAGKSILIEALGLALGDRAETSMLRAGCEQGSVSAVFTPPPDAEFRRNLDEQGIDWAEELLLKRQFGADGRSRAFVNGAPAALMTLRAIGELLADIHGQNEHQSLLRRDKQRELLDTWGEHRNELNAVAASASRVLELEKALARLAGHGGDSEREIELLRYHVGELRAAQPTPEGIAAVEEEHRRLSNAGRLLDSCRSALEALTGEDAGAQVLIERISADLRGLMRIDARFGEVTELLDTAQIQLREAEQWFRRYADDLDTDPARIRRLESQIAALHDLARKHAIKVEQLPEKLTALEERLKELEGGAERREELRTEVAEARRDYHESARTLHQARRRSARKLAGAVSANLQQLGMPGGVFSVEVETLENESVSHHGSDRIEFLVSANPGEPLKPLTKVASGGEISRISLAIQVLCAQGRGVPIFIFDEVDVGIGGRAAEIVGRMLRELGEKAQVLCVTHLPQVAALGHHHLQISKTVADGRTRIAVGCIEDERRVDELARMLGGVTITPQTVAHARSLLTQARKS